jgi:hypothetical protein
MRFQLALAFDALIDLAVDIVAACWIRFMRTSTPEGRVDDLAGSHCVNDAALAVRLERRLDARVFLRRQGQRFVLDRFDDAAAGRQIAEF